MFRPALVVLLAGALAGPARALELSARAETMLGHGDPYVEVSADPDGVSGVIAGAIDIAAPPEVVFAVITDCDLAPRMVDSLKSCRVLERDPDGRWDVREHISRMTFLPAVRNVFRSDYDPPKRVRFHRVGGELRVFEGEWRVEPRAGGVRVFYDSRVSAPFHVPGYLARVALRIEVPKALVALRRECLARAG